MSKPSKSGRRLVITAIFILLGFSIIDLITYAFNIQNVGIEGLMSQAFKVILNLILSYYLYRGHNWARVVIVILLILDSIAYLLRIVEAVLASIQVTPFVVYIGFAFITKGVLAVLLLKTKNING